MPITCPRATGSPATTLGATGSKLESTPPPWSIEITGRSTTNPAKCTTPAAGDRTSEPGAAAMSMPRCPAP